MKEGGRKDRRLITCWICLGLLHEWREKNGENNEGKGLLDGSLYMYARLDFSNSYRTLNPISI